MKSFKHIIHDELGLHARPASMLATAVKAYESNVTLTYNGVTKNANSMLGLMTMAIKTGAEVSIEIDGSDEEKAYEELQVFCKENV